MNNKKESKNPNRGGSISVSIGNPCLTLFVYKEDLDIWSRMLVMAFLGTEEYFQDYEEREAILDLIDEVTDDLNRTYDLLEIENNGRDADV